MKKTVEKKWVRELRSGDWNQITGTLEAGDSERCCLGVLCDIYANTKKWKTWWDNEERVSILSSTHPVTDCDSDGDFLIGDFPSEVVLEWAGLTVREALKLSGMNDAGHTFEDIATSIEKG